MPFDPVRNETALSGPMLGGNVGRFFNKRVCSITAPLIIAAIMLVTIGAFAQGGSQGGVSGVVKDPSGAAIAGATVTLRNPATGDLKTAVTSSEGGYAFNLINNGKYVITVEKEGFAVATYTDVVVLPAQTYSLNAVLKVGAKTETVEVVAGQDLINTVSSEIAGSVTQSQILNLPLLGRNPIELMRNQAGVPGILGSNREDTGINGGRPGWTQITQDGINVQDNFIRNNATDFIPSRPTSDTIGEFSVVTTNVGADSMGGASQVRLITPSGTNQFHGAVYEYNRNNALGAYNFLSKRVTPLPKKPFLNQNQFGAKLGGPILKNKLFFWGSYEGYRLRQQVLENLTVPANADYLTGTYRYVPTGGSTVNAINVINMINANLAALRAQGKAAPPDLTINPLIQSRFLSKYSANGNSQNCGDTTATRVLNTTCNSFNQANPTDRNQWSFRADYNLSSKHTLQFNYQRFADKATRTDIDNVNPTPLSTLSTTNNLYSGAWRWTVTSHLLNEFRAGDYSSVVPFLRGFALPDFFPAPASNSAPALTGLALTAPQTQFYDQGRNVGTRQYMDNASFTHGNHNVQFGIQYQNVAPHPYNFAATIPTVTFGFATGTAFAPYLLQVSGNPAGAAGTPTGASQTRVDAMNSYAAFLAGAVTSQAQTFQVKDLSSGYVPGYPNFRRFSYSIWNYYGKDEWRIRPNLTLTLGLKYEYWTPINVEGSLALEPVISGDLKTALLDPNGKVAPLSQLWKPDRNQFAPSVGFAWTPRFRGTGDGKTVIRGGYSLAFVNEDSVTAAQNAINGNFGLVGAVNQTSLAYNITGAPVITPPALQVNRAFTDQIATTAGGVTAAAFAMDPHLRTPSAHEISFGIQREIPWKSAIEVRYVGTFSRDLWRGVDYNQQIAGVNPDFMADFQRARANGFLAASTPYNPAVCGTITPPPVNCPFAIVYNPNIAGSQQLTYLPQFDVGKTVTASSLTSATVLAAARSGQIGSLADFYVNSAASRASYPGATKLILPNPNIYGADAIINGGRLNYNALQVEFRRHAVGGLSLQANYTYSKDLSDTFGDSQNRFEPLLDNARPQLNYSRSPFDINHVININYVYEFPFGRGKKFFGGASSIVDKIIGGWSNSSLLKFQSGSPFSFISGYSTYQRRSGDVQAYSPLSVSQIRKLLGVRSVNGVTYFIDPSVISSTGTAVGVDATTYAPQFTGQAFFNPQPGQFGSFKKLEFSGPTVISWDTSIKKSVKFWEAHPISVTYGADLFNATNTAYWFVRDANMNINSTSFGRLDTRGLGNRVIQMSLRVDF